MTRYDFEKHAVIVEPTPAEAKAAAKQDAADARAEAKQAAADAKAEAKANK